MANSILCWDVWVPLERVQYCVYLLHRTIIYIINSWTEEKLLFGFLNLGKMHQKEKINKGRPV